MTSTSPGGIVDAHCHIPAPEFVPVAFRSATVDVLASAFERRGLPSDRRRIARMVDEQLTDPDCRELRTDMDRAGIRRAVLIVPDFTFRLRSSAPSIDALIRQAERVAEAEPDRFSLLVGVDPRWGQDGIDLFEAAVARGVARGLKVYPPCGFSPSDPSLFPYYEVCSGAGLPVMVHTGGSIPDFEFEVSRPILVDTAARLFPRVPFILAHGLSSVFDETVMLCLHRPNVYADTSALGGESAYLIEDAVRRGIGYKLIFGSDWPVFRVQDGLAQLVERLTAADGPLRRLGAPERDGVFGTTVTDLLGAWSGTGPPVASSDADADARVGPVEEARDVANR